MIDKMFYAGATLLLFTTLPGAMAQGETRYVSDNLRINLRTGPSLEHRIVRMLPAGEQVTVLATDTDSGYARVRAGQVEGWVLSRQLSDQPSANERLTVAQQNLARLGTEKDALDRQLQALRDRHAQTVSERDMLQASNQRLSRELDTIKRTAARTLEIVQQNEDLRSEAQEVQGQLAALRKERDELRDGTARDWFLVGAGVIVLGIVIGLILPRLHFRRRASSWDSF